MNWQREPYIKLYRRLAGSFAQLPLYVRALAGELLRAADDAGRIHKGSREPWEAVARACGAEVGERRLLKQHVPLLIADGFLVVDGDYLVIRNFVVAQSCADNCNDQASNEIVTSAERTNNETETNSQRVDDELGTNSERTENELKTRSELSARTMVGEVAQGSPAPSRASDLDPISDPSLGSDQKRSDPLPPSGRSVGRPVAVPELTPEGQQILTALKACPMLAEIATVKFAAHLLTFVDLLGMSGRTLEHTIAAVYEVNAIELRSQAIDKEPRTGISLAGLVVSKAKDPKPIGGWSAKAAVVASEPEQIVKLGPRAPPPTSHAPAQTGSNSFAIPRRAAQEPS